IAAKPFATATAAIIIRVSAEMSTSSTSVRGTSKATATDITAPIIAAAITAATTETTIRPIIRTTDGVATATTRLVIVPTTINFRDVVAVGTGGNPSTHSIPALRFYFPPNYLLRRTRRVAKSGGRVPGNTCTRQGRGGALYAHRVSVAVCEAEIYAHP